MEEKTEQEIVEVLRQRIDELGSRHALARELSISYPYLSDILSGNRGVSESVANALGYTIKKVYIPLEEK